MDAQGSKKRFQSSNGLLDSYLKEGVGVIHLKDRVFEIATSLDLKAMLFQKIRLAVEIPDIRVLLIISNDSILGEERNSRFWKSIVESNDGVMQLTREENALTQYIEMICGYSKIVVSAVRGSVVGAFLGASLSTDFRVASENTIFSFPHTQYKMPPQGALAFLLPKYVGAAKAKSILLRSEPISASQALKMGLIDRVVPSADFEQSCFKFARELTSLSTDVVGMTKRLFECSMTELHDYFKLESELVGLHKVTLPGSQKGS